MSNEIEELREALNANNQRLQGAFYLKYGRYHDETIEEAAQKYLDHLRNTRADICPMGDDCDLTVAYMAGQASNPHIENSENLTDANAHVKKTDNSIQVVLDALDAYAALRGRDGFITPVVKEHNHALTVLDSLYDKAALVEKVKALRVKEREIGVDIKEEYLLKGLCKGNNTAIDAILKLIKEQG